MSLTFAVLRFPRGGPLRFGAVCRSGASSWIRHLSAALALTALPACSNADRIFDNEDGGPAGGASVRFTHEGTLELKPSQLAEIGVATSPNATLNLLIVGGALDASLDRAAVQADATGLATANLTAPQQPATFRLRAQLGDISAELPVSVSELGFSDLRVVPSYKGSRQIEGWVADVVVGSTCAEVLAKLPGHPGGLRASSPPDEAPVVESVPVGPKVVAAIHAGEVAAGCAEIVVDTPGKESEVVVEVIDRPMALENADLQLSLEFSPDPTGYQDLLVAGAKVVADTAFPPQQPLAGPLLDAMEASIPPADLPYFQAHRESSQLDTSVAALLGSFDANAWCANLSSMGVSAAIEDAGTSSSVIKGRLVGSSQDPLVATFSLIEWSGGSPAEIGVPADLAFSWSGRPGDVLELSGTIPYSAARLAGHWMHVAAASQYGAASVADSLASEIDCEAIGSLVQGFGSCDQACGEALCHAGLALLWQAGLDAPNASGSTSVSLTAQATVDATLVPTSFSGTWAGVIQALDKSGNLAGTAIGQAPVPD